MDCVNAIWFAVKPILILMSFICRQIVAKDQKVIRTKANDDRNGSERIPIENMVKLLITGGSFTNKKRSYAQPNFVCLILANLNVVTSNVATAARYAQSLFFSNTNCR